MTHINIYCDESNHIESDKNRFMVLGASSCNASDKEKVLKRIRDIKITHNRPIDYEFKWSKVSKNNIEMYLDLINYYFDTDDLNFRAIVIDKDSLDHDLYGSNHDDFYYKMYYQLLIQLIKFENEYGIYIDIKDTRGAKKVKILREYLSNKMYDFNMEIIKNMQQIRSEESEILQVADIFSGAIQYFNRKLDGNDAKIKLIERIQERYERNLGKSTLPSEQKFNLFYFKER